MSDGFGHQTKTGFLGAPHSSISLSSQSTGFGGSSLALCVGFRPGRSVHGHQAAVDARGLCADRDAQFRACLP